MKQWDKSTKRYFDLVPKHYSPEVSDLIEYMLYPNIVNWPTIEDIMNSKIIRRKIKEIFPDTERPKSKGGVDLN